MLSYIAKIPARLGLKRLLGLVLIILGLALTYTFIKPYVNYAITPPVSPGKAVDKSINRIIIPDIKLDAQLFDDVGKLDHGVVFSGAINLGEKTNTVVEGHNIAKDGPLFSLLYLVQPGSEVIIDWQGKRFAYRVKEKTIIKPAAKGDFIKATKDERLTLVTCYPPTSTAMRLIVIAKPTKLSR